MTAALTVPAAELRFEQLAPGLAALEKPLTVAVGPVRDRGILGPAELVTSGYQVRRRLLPGAPSEIWDAAVKRWLPDPGPTPGPMQPLAFHANDPARPWQAILIAAGGVDAAGQPQFGKGTGGYPAYSFQARFATSGAAGSSAPTAPVSFASAADRNLMVFGPGDGEKPDNATLARLELRDPALVRLGGLVLRRDVPGAEITISNAAGASISLRPDGSIDLHPAPGAGVRVQSDLTVERLSYLPADGGPRTTLV